MNHHDFGRATEARFCMDAQLRGMFISRPFDSIPGYDVIVDAGGRMHRVQVKGSRLSVGRGSRYTFHFGANRGHDFDIFAAWLDQESSWLFIPESRVRGQSVTVSPDSPLRKGLGDWEIFSR